MLLFGKDRERYFPEAWIQVGRLGGIYRSRIVDRVEICSMPTRAMEEAIAFVEKHTLQRAKIGLARLEERWRLPPVTVCEVVISMFAHPDYVQRGARPRLAIFDDRLVVEKPGLLPLGLTVEDMPRGVSKLHSREIVTGPQGSKRPYLPVDRGRRGPA